MREVSEALTAAERKARQRAAGRQIAVILTDERALARLDKLASRHGGIKAAVEFALLYSPLDCDAARRKRKVAMGKLPR